MRCSNMVCKGTCSHIPRLSVMWRVIVLILTAVFDAVGLLKVRRHIQTG